MSTEVEALKCPECGAALENIQGADHVFCKFCGTKVQITRDNEQIIRHVDEARIRQSDNQYALEMKKLELQEQERIRQQAEHDKKVKMSIALGVGGGISLLLGMIGISFFALIGLICFYVLYRMWKTDKKSRKAAMPAAPKQARVQVPASIRGYQNKDYMTIQQQFARAGFINIRCVPLNDLSMGIMKKPGKVDSITINGHPITSAGMKFCPDAPVVITYHSMAR